MSNNTTISLLNAGYFSDLADAPTTFPDAIGYGLSRAGTSILDQQAAWALKAGGWTDQTESLLSLTPGMVGIVRPGDHVRHLVPKSAPAKLLIIWVPAGEAERVLRNAKGTPLDPVPEAK